MSAVQRSDAATLAAGAGLTRRQAWTLVGLVFAALIAWLIFAAWPDWLSAG